MCLAAIVPSATGTVSGRDEAHLTEAAHVEVEHGNCFARAWPSHGDDGDRRPGGYLLTDSREGMAVGAIAGAACGWWHWRQRHPET
jgi:hypothetical protein